MKHKKYIGLLLFCFFSLSVQSQTLGSKSVLKMTPAEFNILMETIMEAKQKKVRRRRRRYQAMSSQNNGGSDGVVEVLQQQQLKQRLGDIEKLLIQIKEKQIASTPNSSANTASPAFNNAELFQVKDALLAELQDIKKEIEALPNQTSTDTTRIMVQVPPISTSTDTTQNNGQQQVLFQLLVSNLEEMNRRLSGLQEESSATAQQKDLVQVQQQLDLLTAGVAQSPDLDTAQKGMLAAKLNELKQLIQDSQQANNTTKETTTIIKENLPIDEEYLALKQLIVGKEKTVLFFNNNIVQLSPEAIKQLDEVVRLLQENKRLDVIASGFASEKGSPIYNEAVSQNRTEAVKKYLMKQGLHANRIFTEYHGIDYNVTTPAKARRVEVVLLVKSYRP